MKNEPAQNPDCRITETAKAWDFFVTVGVKGADDLRKVIGLDELNFRGLAPNVNERPKDYFIYRVLDEIQKAALKIAEWKEEILKQESGALHRIDYETTIDDQQFRARKLVEVLVDAILFSTTNDQAHYGDYLLLHELNECARSQEDRYEFFGFHNFNTGWSADWICKEIATLEAAGLDPKSRWYIRDGPVLNDKWKKKGVPLATFRDRYKKILPIALPSELNTIGKSYIHAYSTSKDVHFTPHDTSWNFDEEQVFHAVDRVGLLILALIIRCQLLIGAVPEGINKKYREMHDMNSMPAKLAQTLKTNPAEPGDIVWVHGNYAEVIGVSVSKYGYPACHVRYIERAPLPDVPEDWFAGFEVKLVAKKAQIENAADTASDKIYKETGKHENRTELLKYAKRAAINLSVELLKRRMQTTDHSLSDRKDSAPRGQNEPQKPLN
jgi:hypothetical protein